MRRSALLVAVTVLAIGLAGCSSETPGNATPGGNPDGGTLPSFPEDSTTTDEPTETNTADSGTADLQPCDLLSTQDLTTLNLPESGEENELGPARTCQWQTSGSHTVSVGVIDELGISDVQSESPPEPVTVGSHDAVQYVGVVGTCGVAIGVTDSSRVDVLGTAGGDMTKACEVANQAAELVEPKLP